MRYEFDERNRPISLYSTGAEPEFCYRVQWGYSERVAGIGEKALCITEHKYDANGVRIYSQETWGGNQSIDDYRDLASEANHFSYEAERFSWLDVTKKTERIISLLNNQDCKILGIIVTQADEDFLSRYYGA